MVLWHFMLEMNRGKRKKSYTFSTLLSYYKTEDNNVEIPQECNKSISSPLFASLLCKPLAPVLRAHSGQQIHTNKLVSHLSSRYLSACCTRAICILVEVRDLAILPTLSKGTSVMCCTMDHSSITLWHHTHKQCHERQYLGVCHEDVQFFIFWWSCMLVLSCRILNMKMEVKIWPWTNSKDKHTLNMFEDNQSK